MLAPIQKERASNKMKDSLNWYCILLLLAISMQIIFLSGPKWIYEQLPYLPLKSLLRIYCQPASQWTVRYLQVVNVDVNHPPLPMAPRVIPDQVILRLQPLLFVEYANNSLVSS